MYANSYIKNSIEKYSNHMIEPNGSERIISVGKEDLIGENKTQAIFTMSIEENTSKYQSTEQAYYDFLQEAKNQINSTYPVVTKFKMYTSTKEIIELIYHDSRTDYIFIENSNIFRVNARGSVTLPLSEQNRELVRKILSTFRFTK